MTEDEAKQKWCPMRRLMEVGSVKINNTEPGTFTLNCIGSHCMLWRPHISPDSGYCGLGGKP